MQRANRGAILDGGSQPGWLPVSGRHARRQPGAKGETDGVNKPLRVLERARGKANGFGDKGGPSCVGGGGIAASLSTWRASGKACPGPSGAASDTEEVWARRTERFRNGRGRMKTRI